LRLNSIACRIAEGLRQKLDSASLHRLHRYWHIAIVPKPDANLSAGAIKAFLDGKVAKWWIPDDIVFAKALTYGATGKIQKMELRRQFAGHYLSPAEPATNA
jgi:acyl-coenzyme A synthetase/AMP-(fatty) acid ligase